MHPSIVLTNYSNLKLFKTNEKQKFNNKQRKSINRRLRIQITKKNGIKKTPIFQILAAGLLNFGSLSLCQSEENLENILDSAAAAIFLWLFKNLWYLFN